MRLLSSSWPSFWHRPFVYCLTFLCALFLGAPSHAQNANFDNALTLNDKQAVYDVVSHMYHTRDPRSDLGIREIYLRHRNNLRGDRMPPGPINLSLDPVPHWFIIDISNDSHKSDWVLDFGSPASGRSGLASHIYVQDGQRGITLFEGLNNGMSGAFLDRMLPIHLMPGQELTLVIYLTPSDHAPFVIAPRIIESSSLLTDQNARAERLLQNGILLLIAGTAVFFAGCLFVRRGIGFIPHALFFITQGLWFWISGEHIFTSLPGGANIAGIALAGGGLLALAITQSILASQDNEAGDSLVLYICASFVVVATMLFVFIIPENTFMRLVIAGGATLLAYLIAAFKALTIKRDVRWAGRSAGIAWLFMIAGNGLPYLTVTGFLPMDPLWMQAPWFAMPPVCVLLILSGAAYIRAGNVGLIREVLRQAKRAEALGRLKASKETADQARLLRVIEREREIMEDLRAREAERTEEMRISKISADEANRAKSAFLAVVSHEIRTPMTGIMGMVRLLLDTQMTREQRDYTQTIQDSGDAMLALLNDILDFSKIESGGLDLEVIDFDLHRVVGSVAMLMNGHAAQRGIYLQTDIDPDAPRYLKGDPTRIRQVLLNLVGNAIKFTPRGGVTIRLHAGNPALVPQDKPDYLPVICSVEDTGIGISEEAQKNLFSPFSQADSSIARKFGGTGLGLAICKRLIQAMGSSIELHSVEGQGTTFTFTLVLPPGDQQAAQDQGRGGEALHQNLAAPMSILVVDDNAINRKVMEGLLVRDGHNVTSAASGQEALKILRVKHFDIVFLDIEMPDMDGVEVMDMIREDDEESLAQTPVVALTGNVMHEDTSRYKAAGMRDSLAKPIDPDRLRQILLVHGRARKVIPHSQKTLKNSQTQPQATWDLSADELAEDSFSGSVEYSQTDRTTLPEQTSAPQEPEPMPTQTPKGAPLDETLFDAGIISALRTSLGDKQLNEMLNGVFAHNRTVLPTMQTAFNEGDNETLRGCAHELKGMNGNFGLKALSNLSATVERACRSGELTFTAMEDIIHHELPDLMDRTEQNFPRHKKPPA